MVAAFGIEPLDDAPRRAALAARAIRAALSRAREESAAPWRVSLGLHVASFLVGQLDGGALALDLDAKRRAWTVLEALVAAADPEGVVLSADAARLLDRRFELAAAGSIEGAGPIFRLGGAERAGLGLQGELTRFVGREGELRLLRQRAEATRAGRGQAVAIAGEPGIGKSRLLFELFRYAETEDWRHLEGRCVPHGRGGSPYWVDGRHRQAVERAQADLRVSTEFRNFEAQLALHLQLGQAYHSLGANPQAIEVLGRNAVMLEGDVGLRRFQELPGLPAVLSRAWLVAAHAELGEFSESEARAGEGVAIADAAGDGYDRAVADWAAGMVGLFEGNAGAALEALTRARNGAREGRAQELFQLIGPALGLALAHATRLDEATAVFEEWAAMPEEQRVRADRARGMAWHAEVDRLAGRLESAELRATRAVALARALGERGHEAHALAALAADTTGRGARAGADAEAAFRQALGIAEELEMRPLAARCRARLAELSR